MKKAFEIIKPDSHALGLGLNDQNQPVCLLMSVDSMSDGGHVALQAEYYVLEEDTLRLSGASGSVMLFPVSQMAQDAASHRMPLVVLDPGNEQETMIEALNGDDIYKESRP